MAIPLSRTDGAAVGARRHSVFAAMGVELRALLHRVEEEDPQEDDDARPDEAAGVHAGRIAVS